MFGLDKQLSAESELLTVYFSLKAEGREQEAQRLFHWAYDEKMDLSKAFRDAMAMIQFGPGRH